MGSQILKVEELELDEDEAKKLAKAIQEVGKHYNLPMDPKKIAIANLVAVAGAIYVPRIIAHHNNAKKTGPVDVTPIKEAKKTATPSQKDISLEHMTPSQLWREPMASDAAV